MPLVSVIVPVYNVAPYLRRCLDSLLSQTLKDIEIICINDGSTDDSPQILEEYAKRDDRIRVIHQENRGLSGARNTGLAVVNSSSYPPLILHSLIRTTGLRHRLTQLQRKFF